ncbi:RDD family protein [Shewanella schlegeliana]|uniref:RDD family protein n=1 Tax=Shewanella schlegeliana TaxID=190308 RepID=A0ABS1SZT8_9GAMM|nr:RDD family protein [Shewanella schlegeliana]MBL4913082.1 RDD family protein [Shewanella schlegeliana]MCL1111096.1 RDD family protein [Shewanella schlegeliana]GIU28323.1 RDD domain protein [Shewanella schlegeliana]
MNQQQITKHDDPKTWVTPFAFDVAPNILYLPLASPVKRGLAMLIDGLLVAVLAESAGWIFILLVLGTLLVQKQSKAVGRLFKWGLYLLMLVVLISALVGYFSDVTVKTPQGSGLDTNGIIVKPIDSDNALANLTEMVGYVPAVIVASQCEDFTCAQESIAEVKAALSRSSLNTEKQNNIINELVTELPLTSAEKQQLYIAAVEPSVEDLAETSTEPASDTNTHTNKQPLKLSGGVGLEQSTSPTVSEWKARVQELEQRAAKLDQEIEETRAAQENKLIDNSEETTSPLAWIKGLLNDLGLGFGWAAFYFTVFTAWFDGQTLGKKLFGIRVIQLDGTKISLWDAFGRYGGYAAGFTTGLLGFFQIYWDANRQAIQDKISATVVIDVRKTKHEAAQEHAPVDENPVNLVIETSSNN